MIIGALTWITKEGELVLKNDIVHSRVIHQVLKEKAAQHGNRDFFYFGDKAFGYEDFDGESDRVAAGLQSLGVVKGDKVAIMLGNCPEFLFLWFGISKLGAVEVPINTAHRGEILAYQLAKADCRLLAVEAGLLERLAPVIKDLPGLERLIILGLPREEAPLPDRPSLEYRRLVANDGQFAQPEIRWHDPYAISYTSGTTGPSKGVVLPQNYALAMGEYVISFAEYTEKDCLYNALPLFHGNAQVLSTMPALMSGARMVLGSRFSASAFWQEVKRYNCTAFNYIGMILPILLQAEPRAGDTENPLRLLVGGGCPPELFEVVEKRFGVTIVEGYGMTEIGPPLANPPGQRKTGTIGKRIEGYRIKVVDDEGVEVKPGQAGELLVRPEKPYTMMLEYYKMPQETVEAWRDLWFHTGDYVMEDDEGYFRFIDRKKDALRRGGENISSYEVEKIILGHTAVMECAAIAVKSELAEDEVMVCLSLKPGSSLTAEQLLDYCQDKMAYFMAPRYVRFMEALPKTPTMKVQKNTLRQHGITPDTWDRLKAGYQVRR